MLIHNWKVQNSNYIVPEDLGTEGVQHWLHAVLVDHEKSTHLQRRREGQMRPVFD